MTPLDLLTRFQIDVPTSQLANSVSLIEGRVEAFKANFRRSRPSWAFCFVKSPILLFVASFLKYSSVTLYLDTLPLCLPAPYRFPAPLLRSSHDHMVVMVIKHSKLKSGGGFNDHGHAASPPNPHGMFLFRALFFLHRFADPFIWPPSSISNPTFIPSQPLSDT